MSKPMTKSVDTAEDLAKHVLNRIFSKSTDVKRELSNITDILSIEIRMKGKHQNPYRKAYSNLRRYFTSLVELIDYNMASFNREVAKPSIEQQSSEQKLVFIDKEDRLFMSCPKCNDWIDTTPIFQDGKWGVYSCGSNHSVIFQLMRSSEEAIPQQKPVEGGNL